MAQYFLDQEFKINHYSGKSGIVVGLAGLTFMTQNGSINDDNSFVIKLQ
ncbi:MAG: hypothetical protein PVI44_07350 [Balneolaceae bacterium]|jgi:hypothetical protein